MTVQPQLWIGTSWKMNKTLAEALVFAKGLAEAPSNPHIQRFVIPPFTTTREVAKLLAPTNIKVGAQNMHWADNGAWTGEVSPVMLNDCGLDIVELGHSERRAHFNETDESVGRKVEAAVRHNLIPLVCIGETDAQKDAGNADKILASQVTAALSKLSEDQLASPLLFAYEPVWAIGDNGVPASPDYAEDRHMRISNLAEEICGRKIQCLYGGSVNHQNCAELISRAHIDGLFIGRAAWDVAGYLNILERCAATI